MSAREPRLVLTSHARSDLRDVLIYTEQHWGKEQRRVYRQQFIAAFSELISFPELGQPRPAYGPDIRSLRVGQHVVIYQPHETAIRIVRIIHIRRDLDAEIS